MESKDERQRLLEEWMLVGTIVDENPCGMKNGLFAALREVLHSFIGKACIEGASREQVARYLKCDVRTITRWKERYDDFPKPNKNVGKKDVTYDWMDIVRWKMNHKDLFEGEQ